MNNFSLGIFSLRDSYAAHQLTPADVVREVYQRIRAVGERPTWITLVPEQEAVRRAEALGLIQTGLPLYGVPFAIKDNIDLAGIPTTAACPEYSYIPAKSAYAVDKLIAAASMTWRSLANTSW